MKKTFIITTVVTTHLLSSASPCFSQDPFCKEFKECQSAFHTKVMNVPDSFSTCTHDKVSAFQTLAKELDSLRDHKWNPFVISFKKLFLNETYAETNPIAAAFIKSFLPAGLSKDPAKNLYNGLSEMIDTLILQCDAEREKARLAAEKEKISIEAEEITTETNNIILEEGIECLITPKTTCAGNGTFNNTFPHNHTSFAGQPHATFTFPFRNITDAFNFNTTFRFCNLPNTDSQETQPFEDAPLYTAEANNTQSANETLEHTAQEQIVLPTPVAAPDIVYYDKTPVLIKHVMADLKAKIEQQVNDDLNNRMKKNDVLRKVNREDRYGNYPFKSVNGAAKIVAYDLILEEKRNICVDQHRRSPQERIEARLYLDVLAILLKNEQSIQVKAASDDSIIAMEGSYLNMLLINHSASNQLKRGNGSPSDYLIFRDQGIQGIIKETKGLIDHIEKENQVNFMTSQSALKSNMAEFKMIHEATILQIKYLRDRLKDKKITDQAIVALVKPNSPLSTIHININKTMAFDLDSSAAKDSSVHKRELMKQLTLAKSTLNALGEIYDAHLAGKSTEHPLWPLAQQYTYLINVLDDQIKLIQNHLDEHLAHVTAASKSTQSEDAKRGW